jgi:hypothetical protein
MSRVHRFAIPILTLSTVAWSAVAQDIPGQIPDPSSYQGSMELQRREQESDAQMQQQNAAMQQQLDQNYASYSPQGGGGVGGGGGNAAARLKQMPLLPPAKNPLLGRWRQMKGKQLDLGNLALLPGTSEMVNGALGGACKSVFGTGTVAFTPDALNWVAPDGHEEILNHVEYRSNGTNVIVIPLDPDPIAFIFGFSDRDHVVAAFFGCQMARVGATAQAAVTTAQPAAGAATAAVPANMAVLNLSIGVMSNGQFSPAPAGTQIFVTNQNPDANLMKAGFDPNPGVGPIQSLFAACNIGHGGTQERCNQGFAAMTTGSLGRVASDAAGHAQTGALKPGHYYLVGFAPYQGHSLVWHLPVDLHTGANSVTLTPQNGSLSH